MNKEYIKERRSSFNYEISAFFGIDDLGQVRPDKQIFWSIFYKKEPTFHEDPRFKQDRETVCPDAIVHHEFTHVVHFWTYDGVTLDQIYRAMQGEVWSPNGEARGLIRALGLQHTSMSVGDVIYNVTTGQMFEVAMSGFNDIS